MNKADKIGLTVNAVLAVVASIILGHGELWATLGNLALLGLFGGILALWVGMLSSLKH